MDNPCALHASSLHRTNLDKKFAEWPHDTLALFPDSAGNTVETAMVVKLIDQWQVDFTRREEEIRRSLSEGSNGWIIPAAADPAHGQVPLRRRRS